MAPENGIYIMLPIPNILAHQQCNLYLRLTTLLFYASSRGPCSILLDYPWWLELSGQPSAPSAIHLEIAPCMTLASLINFWFPGGREVGLRRFAPARTALGMF